MLSTTVFNRRWYVAATIVNCHFWMKSLIFSPQIVELCLLNGSRVRCPKVGCIKLIKSSFYWHIIYFEIKKKKACKVTCIQCIVFNSPVSYDFRLYKVLYDVSMATLVSRVL